MARIRYDSYILDGDTLFTITNADTEFLMDVTSESFTNPPIKMRFLNTGYRSFEELCLRAIERDEIEIEDEDVLRMVNGELPGWRLVGAEFEPDNGFSAYYANEHPGTATAPSEKYNYHNVKGASFHFLAGGGCLEVELEVDYADGFPARRYIGKVMDIDGEYTTEVIEYFGKRKIRKMEFSEGDYGDERIPGRLCHITEY